MASTPRLDTTSKYDGQTGPRGFRLCRQCGNECDSNRKTYCSKQCVALWKLERWPSVQRRAVGKRDRGKCEICPTVVDVSAYPHQWEMDHRIPLAEGGTNALDNLRTLCIPCHRRVTKELAGRLARAKRATTIYDPRAPELVRAWEGEPARVLLADPPWRFGDSLPGPGRGASKHYATLTIDEIKSYPLPPLADDCVLVLWRVAAMAAEAYEVVRAWGFTAKSEIVWVKVRHHGSKQPVMGMGRSVRACHEAAILATRGKPVRLSASELSVIFAPRQEHSRKPLEMHRKLERMFAGPYHEMFARRSREGWRCEGNELEVQP
jgi:N6-adenosine-specific RNA methylase IME4/5-methylcytosine-specific restriction endonuclease McrA